MPQKHPLNQQAACTHSVTAWPSEDMNHPSFPKPGVISGCFGSLDVLPFLSTHCPGLLL